MRTGILPMRVMTVGRRGGTASFVVGTAWDVCSVLAGARHASKSVLDASGSRSQWVSGSVGQWVIVKVVSIGPTGGKTLSGISSKNKGGEEFVMVVARLVMYVSMLDRMRPPRCLLLAAFLPSLPLCRRSSTRCDRNLLHHPALSREKPLYSASKLLPAVCVVQVRRDLSLHHAQEEQVGKAQPSSVSMMYV